MINKRTSSKLQLFKFKFNKKHNKIKNNHYNNTNNNSNHNGSNKKFMNVHIIKEIVLINN
jgi:hypothetical protein